MNTFEGKRMLHIMIGLPRSGKSTVALKMGYPVVCPDAIRLSIHGTPFRKEAEGMVWGIAKTMVDSLFKAGHTDVTLDACNVTENQRKQWINDNWEVKFHVVSTPKDVCIQRARETNQEYLIPVIEEMASEYDI
jgi:predicted kinase